MTNQFVDTNITQADSQVDFDESMPEAEVTVVGRNVEIPDHFRVYVSQKLARLEKLARSVDIFDVELKHEPNRRQRKFCQRIQITARGRGATIRSEARADSFYAAFEAALDRLEGRLRRSKDRRHIHYGDKTPVSIAEATAPGAPGVSAAPTVPAAIDPDLVAGAFDRDGAAEPEHSDGHVAEDGYRPGRVVRTKEHSTIPMSVDDALYEMELVGHDFYLFLDSDTNKPSVVYRRRAYDYGLIRLA